MYKGSIKKYVDHFKDVLEVDTEYASGVFFNTSSSTSNGTSTLLDEEQVIKVVEQLSKWLDINSKQGQSGIYCKGENMNALELLPEGSKIVATKELFDNCGGSVPPGTVLQVIENDYDTGDLKLATVDDSLSVMWYYFATGSNVKMNYEVNPMDSFTIIKEVF